MKGPFSSRLYGIPSPRMPRVQCVDWFGSLPILMGSRDNWPSDGHLVELVHRP
jgi:hypothetical protein